TNSGLMQRVLLLVDQGRPGTLAGYLGVWAFCFVALLIAAFQRNLWLRAFWAIVIAVTSAVGFSFRLISGSELGILDSVSLGTPRHEAVRASAFYTDDLPLLALVLLFGILVLAMPPAAKGARVGRWL